MKKPTVLDLFCGCGGMSKGFEMAGFRILAGNDNWDPALNTFEINHPDAKAIRGDIRNEKVRKEIIKTVDRKVDVIIGGPPCQAFSLAGRRDPNDPRGKLFYDYVEIVKHIGPKFFVIENVKGILAMYHFRDDLSEKEKKISDNILKKIDSLTSERLGLLKNTELTDDQIIRRRTYISKELSKLRMGLRNFQEPVIKMIEKEFRKIGYEIKFRTLMAADYGVPQKRQRVIFIGTKKDVQTFPRPTHSKISSKTVGNSILKKWVGVGKVLKEKERVDKAFFHSPKMLAGFRKREKINRKLKNGFGWQILRMDEPSFTISARYWKDGADALVKYSENEIRMLTPDECAAIQSFPKGFKFTGSKRDIYSQIGNAVPPLLAKAIAEEIKKAFN
ncbi:DNA cytosine methyltransferase [Candidatus Aenigmatarchaeota archaeon]